MDVPAHHSHQSNRRDAGAGLLEFVAILGASRWWVATAIVICTAAAVGAAFGTAPRYDAKILLAAVTDQEARSGLGSALGSAMSQLGGLSALTGLNLSASDVKAQAIATLQSEALTERYITENNLLPVLYSRKWDPAAQAWKTRDPEKRPTLWKANQYFDKHVRAVELNGKTGLITMTITWKDPRLAAQWANDLVKLTNQYMRDKAIREAERNIDYLQEQAAKNNIIELRAAIYQLMESEIKKEMLARGSDEYGLKVIDPATVPEKMSFPQRALWISAGVALGLALGIALAALRHLLRGTETVPRYPRA